MNWGNWRLHKNSYAKQKKSGFKKYSLGTTVPICCKLTKMTTERFFSQNPKIVKNRPNLTRKHSKGPPNLKLLKTMRIIVVQRVENFLSRWEFFFRGGVHESFLRRSLYHLLGSEMCFGSSTLMFRTDWDMLEPLLKSSGRQNWFFFSGFC